MAVNDPVVGEIGQIAITVSDVARAKAFYGDVLGLRFLFDAGPNLSFLAARTSAFADSRADVVGHN
jgi:catechol 2,3-dioxygenase-like lactoylglutathione lyase family enzyme